MIEEYLAIGWAVSQLAARGARRVVIGQGRHGRHRYMVIGSGPTFYNRSLARALEGALKALPK